MTMQRREVLAGLAGLMATGLTSPVWARPRPAAPRYLVLIELKGGNDALNTFPPRRDAQYQRLRPNLALGQADYLPITPTVGMHRALSPLMPTWEAGELAVVQGAGYSNPVLSHFESARIWETGSRDSHAETGWLAPIVASAPQRLDPAAVVFGFNPGPLRGVEGRVAQLLGLEGLGNAAASDPRLLRHTPALEHILQVRQQLNALRRYDGALSALPPIADGLRSQLLAQSLRCVAAMLGQPDAPLVYKLVIGGFDTHAGQLEAQSRQLGKLAAAVAHFRELLVKLGLWDQVLVATYSEFGRRVAENASGGTDHGAAQNLMLIGRRVVPGLHGANYDLAALDADGNLPASIDFREIFNAVAHDGLHSGTLFAGYPQRSGLIRT